MPSNRMLLALQSIRDNSQLALDFLGSASVATLKTDRRTFYAISRCLEIVSEATRRLPVEMRERHPELPWRAIMGLGNIYRHDYDNVVEAIVWRTVRESLPPLARAIEEEIARADSGSRADG